jgi:hypothetical protein
MREYRNAARGLACDVNNSLPHFFLRRNDPPSTFFSSLFHALPSFIVTRKKFASFLLDLASFAGRVQSSEQNRKRV